jgi:hypothetical protein
MESLNPRRSLSIGPGDSNPRDPPNREESIEDGECGGYGSIPRGAREVGLRHLAALAAAFEMSLSEFLKGVKGR